MKGPPKVWAPSASRTREQSSALPVDMQALRGRVMDWRDAALLDALLDGEKVHRLLSTSRDFAV